MNASQLEQKYDNLVSDFNLLSSTLYDAEYAMIEEVGRDGFASKETLVKINDIKEQLSDADFNLYCFRQDNAAFVAELKASRAKTRNENAEIAFEKFWNN